VFNLIVFLVLFYCFNQRAKGWTAGVQFPIGARNFFYSTASRPALGPTQTSIQWVPGILSSALKLPGREKDHSPPFSAEVKNGGAIHPLSHMFSWRGASLINHRDNFAFFVTTLIYAEHHQLSLRDVSWHHAATVSLYNKLWP
jgi:hypothetical protein